MSFYTSKALAWIFKYIIMGFCCVVEGKTSLSDLMDFSLENISILNNPYSILKTKPTNNK